MRENQLQPKVIRAGKANLFLSDLFLEAFVNATNTPVELYNCDGSVGAAIGAGIGIGQYKSAKDAFENTKAIKTVEPTNARLYDELYGEWRKRLPTPEKIGRFRAGL
jgi:xylulokinase